MRDGLGECSSTAGLTSRVGDGEGKEAGGELGLREERGQGPSGGGDQARLAGRGGRLG